MECEQIIKKSDLLKKWSNMRETEIITEKMKALEILYKINFFKISNQYSQKDRRFYIHETIIT